MLINIIIVALAAYLLGSISSSVIISRFIGDDVRKKGSGNAGATNMTRIFGLIAGIGTLLGDLLKSAIAVVIGKAMLGELGIAIAGAACLLGHCFPLYFKFKGGKGVSVAAAIVFFMDLRLALIVAIVFFGFALTTKKVSLSSCLAAVSIAVLAFVFKLSTPLLVYSVFCMLLVVYMHRENIKRLIKGTEPSFCIGGKK